MHEAIRSREANKPRDRKAKETKKPTSHTRQEHYKKSSGQEAQNPKNQEAKETKKPYKSKRQ